MIITEKKTHFANENPTFLALFRNFNKFVVFCVMGGIGATKTRLFGGFYRDGWARGDENSNFLVNKLGIPLNHKSQKWR